MPPLARPPPRPAHRPLADPQLRPHRPATAGPALGHLLLPAGPTERKGGKGRPPPRGTGARGGETRCLLATPRSPGAQGCARLSSAPHAALLPASRTPAAVPGRAEARESPGPRRGQGRTGRLQGSRRRGRKAAGASVLPRAGQSDARPGGRAGGRIPGGRGRGCPPPVPPLPRKAPRRTRAPTWAVRPPARRATSPQRPRRARSPGPPAGDGAGSRAEAAGGAEAARPPPAGGGPGPRRHRPSAAPPRPRLPRPGRLSRSHTVGGRRGVGSRSSPGGQSWWLGPGAAEPPRPCSRGREEAGTDQPWLAQRWRPAREGLCWTTAVQ